MMTRNIICNSRCRLGNPFAVKGYEISHPSTTLSPLKLVFNLVQPALNTTMFLPMSLLMRVIPTNECLHVGCQSTNTFSHRWALGCENNPLHPGFAVVPAAVAEFFWRVVKPSVHNRAREQSKRIISLLQKTSQSLKEERFTHR